MGKKKVIETIPHNNLSQKIASKTYSIWLISLISFLVVLFWGFTVANTEKDYQMPFLAMGSIIIVLTGICSFILSIFYTSTAYAIEKEDTVEQKNLKALNKKFSYMKIAITFILFFIVFGLLVNYMQQHPQSEKQNLNTFTPTMPVRTLTEKNIMEAINEYRVSKNLSTLEIYEPLCDLAKIRAYEIREDWSHNGFENRGTKGDSSLFDRFCNKGNISCTNMGENLAKDYKTVEGVLNGWKNSPEHNENMVGDYNVQCVAVIDGYVSSLFAKTTEVRANNNNVYNGNNQIVPYNFEDVKYWEKFLANEKEARDSWKSATKNEFYDSKKVAKMINLFNDRVETVYKIWDGLTNSKLTYNQLNELKAHSESLYNSIESLKKDIYEGAYAECKDFYEDLEDKYGYDHSDDIKDCKKRYIEY